jgi:hypothetical protein
MPQDVVNLKLNTLKIRSKPLQTPSSNLKVNTNKDGSMTPTPSYRQESIFERRDKQKLSH